jgi:hypothetical protein
MVLFGLQNRAPGDRGTGAARAAATAWNDAPILHFLSALGH